MPDFTLEPDEHDTPRRQLRMVTTGLASTADVPANLRTTALRQYCDQLRAAALEQPYVEFVGSSVYHLARPAYPTRCGANFALPYPGRDGTVIDSYIGGTPFPAFVARPSPGRRLCKDCARQTAPREKR